MHNATTAPLPLLVIVTTLATALAIGATGCGAPTAIVPAATSRPAACAVDAPAGLSALVANEGGLVFASAVPDTGVIVQRARGAGCDLVDEGAPFAASELLDADDAGNVYVFPREASRAEAAAGVVSTMLPDETVESMVARVDENDGVVKLVSAGRGIWSFGVSPRGDALWMTACGPTGIFAIGKAGVTPSMTSPDTLWQQLPSVLLDRDAFFSVGVRTCDPYAALTPACGYALVRTTAAGSEDVAGTVVDFGAGFEQGALSRCGADVCGTFAGGVVVWRSDGSVATTIDRDVVGALSAEHIAAASGNRHGVYVLLTSDAGTRAVFVAR